MCSFNVLVPPTLSACLSVCPSVPQAARPFWSVPWRVSGHHPAQFGEPLVCARAARANACTLTHTSTTLGCPHYKRAVDAQNRWSVWFSLLPQSPLPSSSPTAAHCLFSASVCVWVSCACVLKFTFGFIDFLHQLGLPKTSSSTKCVLSPYVFCSILNIIGSTIFNQKRISDQNRFQLCGDIVEPWSSSLDIKFDAQQIGEMFSPMFSSTLTFLLHPDCYSLCLSSVVTSAFERKCLAKFHAF